MLIHNRDSGSPVTDLAIAPGIGRDASDAGSGLQLRPIPEFGRKHRHLTVQLIGLRDPDFPPFRGCGDGLRLRALGETSAA
jgi:hypothetical protein